MWVIPVNSSEIGLIVRQYVMCKWLTHPEEWLYVVSSSLTLAANYQQFIVSMFNSQCRSQLGQTITINLIIVVPLRKEMSKCRQLSFYQHKGLLILRFAHLKPNKVDTTYSKSIVGVLKNGNIVRLDAKLVQVQWKTIDGG